MDKQSALKFSEHWVQSWNSHDLDQILSHYTDDFEMSSPVIVERMGVKSGVLKGKDAVGEYWAIALKSIPDLHFDILSVFTGANSVVIHYKGHKGNVTEYFHFNDEGKVFKAAAHYE